MEPIADRPSGLLQLLAIQGPMARMSSHARSAWVRRDNKLLAALPDINRQHIYRHLEPIEMTAGRILHELGSHLGYAYFPTTAVVSLACPLADGTSTEIASVGHEGVVGVALFLGNVTAPVRAVVQNSGWAYRIKGEILEEKFMRGGAIQRLMLRYTQALLSDIGQTAVCNQRHSVDQRLCRWLLLNLDRLTSPELSITHERISNFVGVRREGITQAARKLRMAGLINYQRGHITVLDRTGLEASCCECYEVVRRTYDRLLGCAARSRPVLQLPIHTASLGVSDVGKYVRSQPSHHGP